MHIRLILKRAHHLSTQSLSPCLFVGRRRGVVASFACSILLVAVLPEAWFLTPILPILKPGKQPGDFFGYRPISLLGPLTKLFDKILQLRVSPAIHKATAEWQGGGCSGTDDSARFLVETLKLLRMQGQREKLLLAFIDGESAFCRPPPEFILEACILLDISPTNWCTISMLPGKMIGTLA